MSGWLYLVAPGFHLPGPDRRGRAAARRARTALRGTAAALRPGVERSRSGARVPRSAARARPARCGTPARSRSSAPGATCPRRSRSSSSGRSPPSPRSGTRPRSAPCLVPAVLAALAGALLAVGDETARAPLTHRPRLVHRRRRRDGSDRLDLARAQQDVRVRAGTRRQAARERARRARRPGTRLRRPRPRTRQPALVAARAGAAHRGDDPASGA